MSWSSRQLPERPYAYVPEEKSVQPGEPIGGWQRAWGLVGIVVVGLLYLWLAGLGESSARDDSASVTNADRLVAALYRAVALLFLNLALGAYLLAKPRLPKPGSWLRTRILALLGAVPLVLVVWYSFSQVESNPWILDVVRGLNDGLMVALVAQLCVASVVAFGRNRGHLRRMVMAIRG